MERKDKPYLRLSVHGLVDFLLRVGDIDDRVYNAETMEMGTLLHSVYQKKQKDNYLAEYPLSEVFAREKGTIALQGRADGIILNKDGGAMIDEIKSTIMELEDFYLQQKEWHLGQASCYALMYAHEKHLSEIDIRMTYISQSESKKKLLKEFHFSLAELEERVNGYIDEYLTIYLSTFEHQNRRDQTAALLPFPFPGFRPGQKDLAKVAYNNAKKGGTLFVEAPTGIGKTISTLYPYVKAFERGRNDRIFYLTAKTTGGNSAYEAIGELIEKGLDVHDSFLLSKDKICFLPGHSCNPDDCPFAKNYYGKLKGAIAKAIESKERFSHRYIVDICKQEVLCPFEFQLDLSLYSDIIICDYNYFFDPLVYLQRYFEEGVETSRYLVLIDEAHNLVDRGRSMYSSSLSTFEISLARKSIPRERGYLSIKNAFSRLRDSLFSLLSLEQEKRFLSAPNELLDALTYLTQAYARFKKAGKGPLPSIAKEVLREAFRLHTLLDDYFSSSSILTLSKYGEKEEIRLDLLCLDPSKYLRDQIERVRASILFSATLSPISYFQKTILGKADYPYLLLPSPFPKENFKLLLAPKVSVKYKDREKTYPEVASYLESFVKGKKGNYFIYFPSYEYLRNIRPLLNFEGASVYMQSKEMEAEEKEAFLDYFPPNPDATNIGLLILGGAFSEGIDLVDDRLIGVCIVGIGLPMVNKENNYLREYAASKGEDGFETAYSNPGINKVMQAVGRLIRTETDVGAALLIDDRYSRNNYRKLFERAWPNYDVVFSPEEVEEELTSFFKSKSRR